MACRFALVAGLLSASALSSTALDSSFSEASRFDDDTPAKGGTSAATLWGWLHPDVDRLFFETAVSLSPKEPFANASNEVGPKQWTTGLDWFSNDLYAGRRYRFADPRRFPLLRRFTSPSSEQYPSTYLLFARHLDPSRQPLVPRLNWHLDEPRVEYADGVAALFGTEPWNLPIVRQNRCKSSAIPLPVLVTGWGADYDKLPLVDCEGAIDLFALDRMSVLARAQNTHNPGYPLPETPSPPSAWPEEWVDGVRLLNPRLLWVIQRIGEAFPRRAIQIMSGYRRDPKTNSPHRQGRALDINVRGVDNVSLFAFCRTLKDVGCGYYPNHPFVHVDVRATTPQPVFWVDVSKPGEPSQYVDNWPGVIESGALAGAGSD